MKEKITITINKKDKELFDEIFKLAKEYGYENAEIFFTKKILYLFFGIPPPTNWIKQPCMSKEHRQKISEGLKLSYNKKRS